MYEEKIKAAKESFISQSNTLLAANQNDCQKLERGFIVIVDELTYDF